MLLLLAAIAGAQQVLVDLHDFGSANDGASPRSGPVFDRAGNMYGTDQSGSTDFYGIVWELTPTGQYTILHTFGGTVTNANGHRGPDGTTPWAGVTLDANGNLYGTTACGGPNAASPLDYAGNVWEITSTGTYLDLHDFGGQVTNADGKAGPDGTAPTAAPTLDSSGNLYGTATAGGPNAGDWIATGAGMVWEITASGRYVDLHDFGGQITNAKGVTGPDGSKPYTAGVTVDAKGNLYGTAYEGGPLADNAGIVWEITVDGTYEDLHDFDVFNGACPNATLLFDAAGNMYGTTFSGGDVEGTVWKIAPNGSFHVLHSFEASSGIQPNGLTMDSHGNLYGTTMAGGANGDGANSWGVVWKMDPSGAYTDLYDMTSSVWNWGGVALDSADNIYGAAEAGGPNYGGLIWCLTSGLSNLTPAVNQVTGGVTIAASVALKGPASYDALVKLSSSSSSVSIPSSILVPQGAKSATFPISTTAVGSATPVTITASYAGVAKSASITLTAPTPASVDLSPTVVYGTKTSTGTVTLNGPAPTGGTTVALSTHSPSASVPTSVTVPAGAKSATFAVTTSAVSTAVSASVEATIGTVSKSATLTIDPPVLASISLKSSVVNGGTPTTGTVTLATPAPTGGMIVSLASSSAAASVSNSVTVGAGQTEATFAIGTVAVAKSVSAQIQAKLGTRSEAATLTIDAPQLTGLSLSPTTVVGGVAMSGTVTLTSIAPVGGFVVSLTSSTANAIPPASVTVTAGSASATFKVTTLPVSGSTAGKIEATAGSLSRALSFTIDAPSLASVTLSPASVKGGSPSTGTVKISSPAPKGGLSITLSTSVNAASVPSTVSVAAGATSATFTVKTSAVKAQTTATIKAGLLGATKTATLTITP